MKMLKYFNTVVMLIVLLSLLRMGMWLPVRDSWSSEDFNVISDTLDCKVPNTERSGRTLHTRMIVRLDNGSPTKQSEPIHAGEAIISISDKKVECGEDVTIHISLDNTTIGAIDALQFTLIYDRRVFHRKRVNLTARSENIGFFLHDEIEEGYFIGLSGASQSITPGTGPIIDYLVNIDERASNGTFEWTLSGVYISSSEGSIPYRVENGHIRVTGGDDIESRYSPTPPKEFCLEQNHPNPFNPNTSIQYSVVSDQTKHH